MYLLDTNICIYFLQQKNPILNQRLADAGEDSLALCAIVRAELMVRLEKAHHPSQQMSQALQGRYQDFIDRFVSYPFDNAAADEYAKIRAFLELSGQKIGDRDMMIAATARVNELIILTNNTKEFRRVPGLFYEDWSIQ